MNFCILPIASIELISSVLQGSFYAAKNLVSFHVDSLNSNLIMLQHSKKKLSMLIFCEELTFTLKKLDIIVYFQIYEYKIEVDTKYVITFLYP